MVTNILSCGKCEGHTIICFLNAKGMSPAIKLSHHLFRYYDNGAPELWPGKRFCDRISCALSTCFQKETCSTNRSPLTTVGTKTVRCWWDTYLVREVEALFGSLQLAPPIHSIFPTHPSLHMNNVQFCRSRASRMLPQECVPLHSLHVLARSSQIYQNINFYKYIYWKPF